MSRAKKDLDRLAEYLVDSPFVAHHGEGAVDMAIRLISESCEPLLATETTQAEVIREPETLVLVASTKAKSGQQPWSEWPDMRKTSSESMIEPVVRDLTERVRDRQCWPGQQFEVMEVVVMDRAVVETLVNVRGA